MEITENFNHVKIIYYSKVETIVFANKLHEGNINIRYNYEQRSNYSTIIQLPCLYKPRPNPNPNPVPNHILKGHDSQEKTMEFL